ncbi:MAG: carbohydrate kinase [Leptolyngbyaceae bacterium]|nr:carbohydrate kinase [Leptolyngbyaceae bacterium]
MSNPRVLCLGELLFDIISNEPGVPYEEVKSWTSYPGGAPANVACALVKLGTSSGFVGCVGSDEPGEALVSLLENTGVNTAGVQRHPTAPTREIYVVRTETGDRQFVGFGDRQTTEFADAFLADDDLPSPLFETADYLVLGTLEMAYELTYQAIERALDFARQYSITTVLDVNWRPMFWQDVDRAKDLIRSMLNRFDILKLSDDEATWLFDTQNPEAIAHRLAPIQQVIVTAGEQGCAYTLAGNTGKVPAFDIDVDETTGSGDSFLAGFLHQLCQRGQESLRQPDLAHEIVTYASAVGALTATRPGAIAAQPTRAEVEAFLHLYHQDS